MKPSFAVSSWMTTSVFLAACFLTACASVPVQRTVCPACPAPPACPSCPPCPSAPLPSSAVLMALEDDQLPHFVDEADTASLRTAAWNSLQYFRGLKPHQS